jgi:LuxR family transcriptional regulator, maltose regulon positive regulatory protein
MNSGLARQRRDAGGARPSGKLVVPTLPGRVVQRGRLFSMLDVGVERAATLVAAPAGSGKTIMLASWLSARPPAARVAWISLDAGDNDPVRFWTHLIAACARLGLVMQDSDLHTIDGDAQLSIGMAPRFVEQLDSIDAPVVVILDDVHELTNPRVLSDIEFLVRHPPSSLRLVLSTRADPPLPLYRLLLTGSLAEIRAADLAFTSAEVAELLDEYDYRPQLSAADVTRLWARTEGWAAGVRLAAVSMQGHPDPHRFVVELSGDDRSLSGYLVSEVLNRQPAKQRNFMIKTCVVNELSGTLADALTGGDDGERTLAGLASANAFVMPMGERRGWYRYHPLFAELLRYELRREMPSHISDLHLRAAYWYERQGLPVAAIEQMVLAQDWRSAAELLATQGLSLALRHEWADFQELVDKLPTEIVRTEPELALVVAAQRLASRRDDPVEYLRLAREQERRLTPDRRARFTLLLAICRITWARQTGDCDEVLAAAQDALTWLRARADDSQASADSQATSAVALLALGVAEFWLGQLDAAEEHLAASHAAARWCDLTRVGVESLSYLGLLQAMTGRLTEAVQSGQLAMELSEGNSRAEPTALAAAFLAIAWAHRQRNDVAIARSCLDRAGKSAAVGSPLGATAKVLESRLRLAEGDIPGAFVELRAARQGLKIMPPPLLAQWLATTETELHLAVGDVRSARLRFVDEGRGHRSRTMSDELILAQLMLAEGDPAGARRSLSTVIDRTAGVGDPATRAQAWLLHGRASHALGKTDEAATAVGRIVDLIEPEENRRLVLDAGSGGRSLLVRYRNRVDSSWAFLDELVRERSEPVERDATPLPAVIEPLSQRERDVLGYLPTMLTFLEIGSELYISVNTTKSHVRSIYRKLGVVGRRDAVTRARQLHLIRS